MKKKTFAVLGLGKFGASVAIAMAREGAEVLAVDSDEDKVHSIADKVTHAVQADVCDIEAMKALGLSNMDGVVVSITGSLDASILATIFAKEEGVPLVLAKANDEIHTKILEKVGATKVIVPEKESGVRMAYHLLAENFLDIIELSDKVSMVEISVRPEWVGKNLRELNFRQKANANVVAVRMGEEVSVNMDPDKPLEENMVMWVTVNKSDVNKLMG